MGNLHFNAVDTSVAPGGVLLYVQKMAWLAQPSFSEPKPASLSTISDSTWQVFHGRVAAAASHIWSERASVIPNLIAFVFMLLILVPRMQDPPDQFDNSTGFPLAPFFVIFLMILGPRYWMTKQNEIQDQAIREACADLSSASGMTVQYRTQWTGMCRPKFSRPLRAIAIMPSIAVCEAALMGDQIMSVQVPQGAGPGTALHVQSPSGDPFQVVVPSGVMAGQIFQARVPASTQVVVGTVVPLLVEPQIV